MRSRRTWRLIRETNAELEATEPWKAEPGPATDAILGNALEALRIVALLIDPGNAEHERRDLEADRADGSPAGPRAARRTPPGEATRAVCRCRRASPSSRGVKCDRRAVRVDRLALPYPGALRARRARRR